MNFKDHFSTQAADYAKYRPDYPQELYDFILLNARGSQVAWDCGTGNGQVAVALSDYFEDVMATDPSAKQIANAIQVENISYRVAPAEASGLTDNYVDLITVGQAAHWFDLDKFYAEAKRVAKPGAMLIIWGYGLHSINPTVDAVISRFYHDTVGSYWPPERGYLDNEYRDLPFPFPQISVPPLAMEKLWTLADLIGYLNTWSSVQAYIKANGTNPVELIFPDLSSAWGSADIAQPVRWPLYVLAGYVH